MTATHIADVYGGTVSLVSVRPDPKNTNMVFGLVVRDTRRVLHTGCRVWVAAAQVKEVIA